MGRSSAVTARPCARPRLLASAAGLARSIASAGHSQFIQLKVAIARRVKDCHDPHGVISDPIDDDIG
jgi:hypothetical protein